jgi:DNA-binding CsgD family transcriptional regulator
MLPFMRRGRPAYPDILTPREWEVLSLIREGLTNPQIAQRLGVTEGAAKFHVSQILAKLGVESRQEAASYTAARKRAWLLSPFLAFTEFWKPAVRRWTGLVAITAAAVTTMALIVLMGVSSVGRGGEGASPSAVSTLDEALGPDEPPAQATTTNRTGAPLGSSCQVTLPPAYAKKDLSGGDVGMSREPFCIAWTDIYTDESGFRVVVGHGGTGHAYQEFVYNLPANVNEVFPPESDWPPRELGTIEVRVYAEMSAGEVIVDGFALQVN